MLDLFVGDGGGVQLRVRAGAQDHVGEAFLAGEFNVSFRERPQHSELRLPFLRRFLRLRRGSHRERTHERASGHPLDCTVLLYQRGKGVLNVTRLRSA